MLLLLVLVCLSFGMDIRQAMDLLEEHPTLKSLEEERKVIRALPLTYRSYLNPTVSFQLGNFGTSTESYTKSPVYNFSYSQPIAPPSIRKGYVKLSELEENILTWRIESQRVSLRGELYRAFMHALYLRERIRVLEESLKLSSEVYSFVKRTYDLGETTKLDLFRAEREMKMAQWDLDLAKKEYAAALVELSYFTGRPVDSVDGDFFSLPEIKLRNLEDVPVLKVYKSSIESEGQRLVIERILSKPKWSLEALTEKVSDRSYGVRVGLSVELPLFYSRELEIIQRLSQREILTRQSETEELRLKALTGSQLEICSELKRQIDQLENNLVPEAQKELALALKSYRLKVITLLELSEVKRRYYELLSRRLELYLRYHQAFGELLKAGVVLWR
ncbi:TolC family protein [Thermocrinis minervae]|uniref:Outer membrane protein TolC n=1 Tax=Thermocrinis minervae TaxID=381751 RepID=A0A1M6QQZ9_9AQUI|nr:TolC family protein [Thermocrinis minervae]SHK22654.1 Outer membrane protein TolC [Thermocrinis minervae]